MEIGQRLLLSLDYIMIRDLHVIYNLTIYPRYLASSTPSLSFDIGGGGGGGGGGGIGGGGPL